MKFPMTASFPDSKSAASRHQEERAVTVTGSIRREDVTTVNMHAPDNGAPKFTKQKPTESKKKTDKSTVIGEDFRVSLSIASGTVRQAISKETEDLTQHSKLLDPTDISRALHQQERPSPQVHLGVSRIDRTSGHKTRLNKRKSPEIIPSIFSKHDGMKLEISNQNNFETFVNMWQLSNPLLIKQRVNNNKNHKGN